MKNISIWKESKKDTAYPSLKENKEVDVLIIGGGVTGASVFNNLKNSNLKVILVEQNKIAFSTTGNSTGKISFLQNDLIDKIRKNFNDDIASLYLKSQLDGIKIVTDTIKKEGISCDLEKVDSYLYTEKDYEMEKIKDLEKFLEKNNIKVEKDDCSLVKSKYMIKVTDTYMFNPVKYVYGLLKDEKNIYENTMIKKIEKDGNFYICMTENYKIKTKWVVIASHYPYFNYPYFFPIKASLEKSYLSASKYKTKDISLISYSYPFISLRTYKDYLIYLSNSHSIEKNIDDKKNFNELLKKVNDLNLKPDFLWSNIDIITSDGLPFIGRLKDKILIATGYNTWGFTNSALAGKLLVDIINNKDNKYIKLFDPNRKNLEIIKGGFVNSYKNLTGIINGYLYKNSKVTYKTLNGKKIMIYNDKEKEYKVIRKCPHLGCSLTFNEIEKTWDCPCHGSRFNLEGKVISAPSNHDITFKN